MKRILKPMLIAGAIACVVPFLVEAMASPVLVVGVMALTGLVAWFLPVRQR